MHAWVVTETVVFFVFNSTLESNTVNNGQNTFLKTI